MTGHSSVPDPAGDAGLFEHELQMTREAIAFVASGRTASVVVAGMRHGERVLDEAQRLALEAGLRIKRLPRADQSGTDLLVTRIQD